MTKANNLKKEIVSSVIYFCLFVAVFFAVKNTSWGAAANQAISDWFISHRIDALNPIGVALEYVGHWPLPALVALIMLIKKDTRFSYGIPLAVSVSASVGLYELFKNVFKNPRPDSSRWLVMEHGYSFPSGHTLNNTVFWTVFALLLVYYFRTNGKSLPIYKKDRSTEFYPKKQGTCKLLRAILFIWPLIIAFSRIYVGVHWPGDVLGAWCLAACLINVCKAVLFKGEFYEA